MEDTSLKKPLKRLSKSQQEIVSENWLSDKVSLAPPSVHHLKLNLDGILSTPALSAIVRKQQALGGILLTASHNPGGIDADFGIKYNCANGGPAPESITNKIYEISKEIGEFKSVQTLKDISLEKLGATEDFDIEGKAFSVEIVDSTNEYFELMKQIFDFELISNYLKSTQKVFYYSQI